MAVSHTGTYWQSHLQDLCKTKGLADPIYEVFEHSGGSAAIAPGSGSTGQPNQSWYSCVVKVGEQDYDTSYVYKAEENARERAAKKAFESLSSSGS